METVAHKVGNFALSISISIIFFIYVITEQTAVLRGMLSSGSFFIFSVDQCGNSVEGNRE